MAMRTTHRPRHEVPGPVLILLRPVVRYSLSRDAYILRGVGRRFGPVLRRSQNYHHN